NFNSGVNTDWWDAVTRNGIVQEYGVTASGGTEKTKFFISGGYFDNKGIFYGSDFKRYSARVNVDHQATKYLTLGMNMSGAYAQINQIATGFAFASPIISSFMMRPTDPIKNADGTWFAATNNNGYNPVALYQSEYPNQGYQQQYKALVSPYVQIKFYKNVYFQSKVGIDFTSMKEKNVWSSEVSPDGQAWNGLTQNLDQTEAVLNITNTLNWLPSIGKNNFNILLGQEAQKFTYHEMYANGKGFTTPMLTAIANAAETDGSAIGSAASLQSFFANAEYDYSDKYYLSASIRYDGSSRFGTNNKWGTFFSVGGKYRISQEEFMAGSRDWLNNLTIRVSYGTSGNQNVGYYAALGLYGSTTYAGINGLYPATIENPNLKWETRNKFNAGIDFTIFDIFTMELDYYNDVTKDMHFGVPQSFASGVGSTLKNIGSMRNQGVEFQINALLINQKNFKWTAALNFTSNKNEILALATDKPILGNMTMLAVGKPYGSWYLEEWAGVDPQTGAPRWYGPNGEYVYAYSQAVKKDLGSSSQAKFYGGFSTRFDFFNFDFGIQLNYNFGNKVFINDLRYFENIGEAASTPTTYYVFDNAWKSPENPGNGDVPRLQWGGNNGAENWSSRQLVDCSYLRIKSIMLGYTIPTKAIRRAYLSSFRAYIAIDNLYTVTNKNFRGYDPESGLGGSQLANYPTPINYTIGINVGF
ncbi:MAG: SusC/RagA family TonB-linked outer membrane protein, partial [Bacteroidales bacterium]